MIKKNKSDFFENVYTVVKKIPFGKVTTLALLTDPKYLAIAPYVVTFPNGIFLTTV